MKCLVYIAGDVSKYNVTEYEYEGKTKRTFFSAHAIASITNSQRVIALLPDSLLYYNDELAKSKEVLIKAYKDMILKRAKELAVNDIEQFVNSLEVVIIPNVGVASAYVVKENGEFTSEKRPYRTSRSPVFIYNVIYSVFKDLEECDEFVVDLTHGTNVLVAVTLAAASLFNSRFVMAPVMGTPGDKVAVVDITDVVNAFKDSYAINMSIEKVDERYFKDYSDKLRRLNVSKYKEEAEVLKKIRGVDPGKVISFLRDLRLGFSVNALRDMEDVKVNLESIKGDVERLKEFYSSWYNHLSLEKEGNIVLSNFYSTFTIERLILEGSDIEKLEKLIDVYINAKYYDNALALARELAVAICMDKRGGGVYTDEAGSVYEECDKRVTDEARKLDARVLQYRNVLMHGGLSVDLRTKVEKGSVTTGNNSINADTIAKYVEGELKRKFEELLRLLS